MSRLFVIHAGIPNSHFKIVIHGQMGELNSTNTGDDILQRPLISKNIEEFQTGRTNVDAITHGIRDFPPIHVDEKCGIDKVGMVC